ncbi:unnamed protein product [Clonostachys chloroleuca]|uniref:FAD dependent oxidoreductase domain-containing protein n=1 Tax=Clonostachys chloroleuca TaxID=1926264 RepID=A0AA35Q4L3_9HYPO|nr:unnamed protein product [Clonostachys chloroleuca]
MSAFAQPSDPIVIIGAGVFGLSTALHLAQRGFKDVTILDKQDYDEFKYSYLEGCDAPSADMNKIIRAAYGPETVYQDLSFEAMDLWRSYNDYIAAGRDLPAGISQRDEIWVNSGNLQMCGQMDLPRFERLSIENMRKAGQRHTQVVVTEKDDVDRAEKAGFGFAVDPFGRRQRNKPYQALLDTSGGFVYADKACRLVLHLARRAGVKTVLGQEAEFAGYHEDAQGNITGVKTVGAKTYPARLVVVACGSWTQQIVPDMDDLCEATGGSVAVVQIPKTHELYERFSPHNFPTWTYKMRDGAEGGLYGFPVDENGYFKIGYRGTKYTNPRALGTEKDRSVPVTRWSKPDSITRIPSQALNRIRSFLEEFIPELGEAGLHITFTRLCWYNDSFDNHFVIDHVPRKKGLMVATGGSGHAFMFLPNIGKYVVDKIEGKNGGALDYWKWRHLEPSQKAVNVLGEGRQSTRALQNHRLYQDDELVLGGTAGLSKKSRL